MAARRNAPVDAGFGLAIVRMEGAVIPFDNGARRPKGGKRAVDNDWMELPIPKNMSRARVHKLVDAWLDDRAGGYKYRTYRIRGAMRSPQIEAALKRSMRRTP